MALKFAIQTAFEILVIVLIIYGFIYEDKLIAFEDKVKASIKSKRSDRDELDRKKQLICPGAGRSGAGKKSVKAAIGCGKLTVRATAGTGSAVPTPTSPTDSARFPQ